MIRDAIAKLVERKDLSEEEMSASMLEIMNGETSHAQIGAFITALRMKGETTDEIVGAARVMRGKAIKITAGGSILDLDRDDINLDRETILDTCGTGGDGTMTFNVSTATALVVASGGIKVAKHGNRSVSSLCGSADVLQELGVNVNATPEVVSRCIENAGIGFLFAPSFHGAMKNVITPRREIGIRTIFNILGPLTNPAGAQYQVMGVYREDLCGLLASALCRLGTIRGMVVHGMDGIDEITVTDKTSVCEIKDGGTISYNLVPEDFGVTRYLFSELHGGTAADNAEIINSLFRGELGGAKKAIVQVNAAAALFVAGKVTTLREGAIMARELIESGAALNTLKRLVKESNA